MSEDKKNPFFALVEELEKSGSLLTQEQVDETFRKRERQMRVDGGNWPITDQDKANIVRGTLRQDKLLRSCDRWVKLPASNPRGGFLVLLGERGIGKTVAACWLLAQYGGYYVDAPELIRMHHSFNERDQEAYRYILDARLVVLDDLGTERLDDRALETLSQFVNRRQSGRKTLITGNGSAEMFRERYEKRMVDRIEHTGYIVDSDGINLRKPQLRAV